MDPREVMLAEMARAFNLGLGLGGDAAGINGPPPRNEGESGGNRATSSESGHGGGESGSQLLGARQLPPEDSFERFLMDLQTELRVVLSQPVTGGDGGEEATSTPPNNTDGSGNSSITPSSTTAPSTLPTPPSMPIDVDEEQVPPLDDDGDSEDEDEEDEEDETEEGDGETATVATDGDVSPVFPNPAPSTVFPFPHDAQSTPEIDTAATTPQGGTTASSTTFRTETRPGSGINWWRLYRFPPITSPHPQGVPATFNAAGFAPSQTRASDAMPHGAAAASTDSVSQTVTLPSASREGARNNTVVPVIVVGLQSVSASRRREHQHQHQHQQQRATGGEDEDAGGRDGDGTDDVDDDDDFDGFLPGVDGESGNGEAQRGRRWRSRAANAIRNLRPGRRGGPSGRIPAGDGPGSRTFLIYVIGGECLAKKRHWPMFVTEILIVWMCCFFFIKKIRILST